MTKSLVISRPDRLGDLMCALPAVAWAQRSGVDVCLHLAPGLERIGEWAQANGLCQSHSSSQKSEVLSRADAFVALVHHPLALEALRRVPGPSWGPQTRLSSLWTYTHPIRQKRSLCEKSESAYNADLVAHALRHLGVEAHDQEGVAPMRQFPKWPSVSMATSDCVLNVSNRSSALNAPLETYVAWGDHAERRGLRVGVLAVGDDASTRSARLLQARPHWNQYSQFSDLSQLVQWLSQARCLVTSSTGALHVGAALGIPRIHAFFPRTGTGQWRRWQPDAYWTGSQITYSTLPESPMSASWPGLDSGIALEL